MSFNHTSNPKLMGGTLFICPLCKKPYNGYSALSRKDNKTEICPQCGQKEALEAFQGYLKIQH